MRETEVLIIGGGPAGLCAAVSALESGASVTILERNRRLGGQLVKQTHMFFGSKEQYASFRGIDIPAILLEKLEKYGDKLRVETDCTALGIYEDGVVTALFGEERYVKYLPKAIVVATGASEKALAFENNDLPGIYGAGAVQTLMNVYGVKPGNKVLMVGAGNIGLIVSYQLMQAGVEVVAVLDAAPKIGGYCVHASKIRRAGVPILVSHTVTRALGDKTLEGAIVCEMDEKFNVIEGTEKRYDCDVMCISVGLTPLTELLGMAGCEMKYVPELSGIVPARNKAYMTSRDGIFVAGDVSGIEEASAAMVEGYLAGLHCAAYAGYKSENFAQKVEDLEGQLAKLRGGPSGAHILRGIQKNVKED
ncbi:MAG: NAD(P)/FAD-dependent oxidoreductase [Clostridia bacterium]|nr:NAD(P)/FAD-dependent oxidoreductase [Clostridia bacterium]